MAMAAESPSSAASSQFASTQWSVVRQAASADPALARDALAELCSQYWFPLYAYVRRRTSAGEAEDLTQAFFAHLLSSPIVSSAERAQGKFRAYLLACCNHFLANERAAAAAQKRGGGQPALPLDSLLSFDPREAVRRYDLQPATEQTPERLFDRQWALALLEAALVELAGECGAAGDGPLFERLKPMLAATGEAPARYAAIAAELGLSEDAVKKSAQRLRQRYGAILRRRVGATVSAPGQLEEEIRDLFAALRS